MLACSNVFANSAHEHLASKQVERLNAVGAFVNHAVRAPVLQRCRVAERAHLAEVHSPACAATACLYPILTTSNAGVTVPVADADGGSIYTDSFNASLGTSFSAPLVSGTVALMLSAQPALTPVAIEAILRNTARAFPPAAPPLPQCVAPQPAAALQIDQLECGCTTATCGAGMLDVGAAVFAARAGAPPNYTGLFWNSPAGSESGWGINFAHQGDVIFATWFTYDLTGKAWWLAMPFVGWKLVDDRSLLRTGRQRRF